MKKRIDRKGDWRGRVLGEGGFYSIGERDEGGEGEKEGVWRILSIFVQECATVHARQNQRAPISGSLVNSVHVHICGYSDQHI